MTMHTARLRTVAAFLLAGSVATPRSAAQWGISLEAHQVAFGGSSLDTSVGKDRESFRPAPAVLYGLRLDRRVGRLDVALALRFARPGVILERKDIFAGQSGEFTLIEAAPEASYRLITTSAGARVHVYAGPVLGVWLLSGENKRTVPGAAAGLAGEFAISRRLGIWLRAGGALSRSVFQRGELPPEFVLRATRRAQVSLGLRYGG